MTILETIGQLDNLKPNAYTVAQKVGWLNKIEGRVHAELIQTHANEDEITFDGYTSADMDTVLIAPEPYDELYLYGLMVQVDLHNLEYEKYNNSAALFNAAYDAFARFWNREFMPMQRVTHFAL